MTITTLFTASGLQTVCLPEQLAFPKTVREVAILRDGARRVIVPANALWADVFDAPGIDLGVRGQPQAEVRKNFSTSITAVLTPGL